MNGSRNFHATKGLLVAGLMAAILMISNAGFAMADVKDRMVERRAIEAAVWGMPIVNFQAMRDGLKKDAGVCYNDVAYNSKVQTWRLRATTNNNTTPYIFVFWNRGAGFLRRVAPASFDMKDIST